MYMLFDNIVFDIIHSVVVCVDFLGTHITSLVLFFKTRCDTKPLMAMKRVEPCRHAYGVQASSCPFLARREMKKGR